MAKKKRRRRLEYVDYEHAVRDVEKLASEDKVDSEEYEAAIEAATQFFLRSNGAYRFNQELESAGESHQEKPIKKHILVVINGQIMQLMLKRVV